MIEFKNSICQILCQNQIKGTGFYIGQGRVITATHVIDKQSEVQACFVENAEIQYIYECCLQEKQPGNDICILVIDENQYELEIPEMKFTFRCIAVNSTFFSYGYPGENQGNMSFISGKILNTHDGCSDTVYTADLEIIEGKLHNYQGLSGAPAIIDDEAVGICTYQCNDQLRLVEFSKNVETLADALNLKLKDEKRFITNVPENESERDYIYRKYLENEISTQINAKETSINFVVKGCNGVGKTTWIEQLENWGNIAIIGKYYINRMDDNIPSVYRKSEEALYDWFCKMVGQFAIERIEISGQNSYVDRMSGVKKIYEKLDEYLESIDKQGVICIDGLDEFVNDDMREFDIFCSYLTVYRGSRIHFIFTLNSEKILPISVKKLISEENILKIQPFDLNSLRAYLLNNLCIDNAEKYVDQLVEKSEGHALYLHYIIESLNNLNEKDDIASFVDDFPAYGGDINKYYNYKWNEIKKNQSIVKLVAYLARTRIKLEKSILLQMVSPNESIAFDVALDEMNGLLIQDKIIGFFHGSFQKYVSSMTKYLDEEVHHIMAAYCLSHQNVAYGVTQLLYHLSNGKEEDQKKCVESCNQEWLDKCGELSGGPEVMLHDIQIVLGLCCDLGEFAQLIDKLLLMQRAQVRYDEIFARFAGDLAMVEIEFNRPEKAMEYLYRFHTCIVNDEQLLSCLERMISKEQWECVDEVIYRMETDTYKLLYGGQAIPLQVICTMNRAYQMGTLSGSQYYFEKAKLFKRIIFSQKIENQSFDLLMQSSTDYNLWKNGVVATAESLKAANIPVNQKTYNNWILSIVGAAEIESYVEQKSMSWIPALEEIIKLKDKYICEDYMKDTFVDICMCRREYAALLPKEYIDNSLMLKSNNLRNKNGVDIDYNKIQNLFVHNRNQMYLSGDEEKCTKIDDGIWETNWEEGLNQLVCCVGSYYGLGLKRTNSEDVESFKQILKRKLFTFDERTKFIYAYHIPENVMEYIMLKISMYFLELYPEEIEWFLDFVQSKSKEQFGIYYEGYFRIMIQIIGSFQKKEYGDAIIDILNITFKDIILKVTNRYERTNLLLKIVKYFIRSGCEELAKNAYKEMLKSSMGPLWYKEAQYSLIEQSIRNMQVENINEEVVKQSMAILDAASGGMTFERYIRTTKESLIEEIWKKGKYKMALQCMRVQLLPKDWQSEIMNLYEPVDQKNNVVGNYHMANCIFPQRMMFSILEDSNIPDDFRWVFCEIFILVERRNFHNYIGIQAEILARSRKQKKKYYDRILNILVCDASKYYFQDLLDLYQKYLSDDEYQVVLELLEEYIGTIESKESSKMQDDEVAVEKAENQKNDDKAELLLPGTWGKRTAIDKAEEIWNEVKIEEKKQNIFKVKAKCIEIINVEEANGWPIWNHGSNKYADLAIEKLSNLSEKPEEFLGLLKDSIMAPKYSARWQEVEKLLDLLKNLLTTEEKLQCHATIINHYKEMMNIPESLNERYSELKDDDISVLEACYELLLNYMVYPQHFISQKSIEMFSWIMENNEELLPLLIKYCQSDNVEIAEICSSYCLKLSERLNHTLMKALETTENLEEIIKQSPWMIVRGNMYLVLQQYAIRSRKLKCIYENVSEMIFCKKEINTTVEGVNTQRKLIEINKKCHCMEESQFQIISNVAIMNDELWEEKNQGLFDRYVETICAGFHDNSLKTILWRNRWYELINTLQFNDLNEKNLNNILNALRRVNWTFPLPDAKNVFVERNFFDIKKILLEDNMSILNNILNGDKILLAYHGVKMEEDKIETVSLRSFLVSKQLPVQDMVNEVAQGIGLCGISDYPYVGNMYSCNVKEITLPWYPGSLIGFNFSNKLFDLDVLAQVGITGSAVDEGVFIGDREWEKEQSGRPCFYCSYGSVLNSKVKKNCEHKVIIYIEYQYGMVKKEILVDLDTHKVIQF